MPVLAHSYLQVCSCLHMPKRTACVSDQDATLQLLLNLLHHQHDKHHHTLARTNYTLPLEPCMSAQQLLQSHGPFSKLIAMLAASIQLLTPANIPASSSRGLQAPLVLDTLLCLTDNSQWTWRASGRTSLAGEAAQIVWVLL